MKTHHKRKKLNLNVKKEFQKWLLVRILAAVCLSSIVAALILYFYARNEISGSFYQAHVQVRRVSDLLLPVVLAGSFISLLSGTLLAIFLPQRIAGPIYRIEEDLKKVEDGDLTFTIKLRKGDILLDLATTINRTIISIQDRISRAKQHCTRLEQALTDGNPADQEEALREVTSDLNQLKT